MLVTHTFYGLRSPTVKVLTDQVSGEGEGGLLAFTFRQLLPAILTYPLMAEEERSGLLLMRPPIL